MILYDYYIVMYLASYGIGTFEKDNKNRNKKWVIKTESPC